MPKRFTLGKKERLKSRKQIEKLFEQGKSFTLTPFRTTFLVDTKVLITNNKTVLQFGIGVSNKNFKKAVDRNRIKRLTREAWRLQKNELNEKLRFNNKQLNVFLIYIGKELPEFVTVKEKVNLVLKKLDQIINENNSKTS